jgi:hypothetical protein
MAPFPQRTLAPLALLGVLAWGSIAAAAAVPSPVVDTGQTTCHGTTPAVLPCPEPGAPLFGQDAQYHGRQPAYRDNGDGTVSDLVTGLMWEKEGRGDVSWNDATGLAAQARTAGHGDWRVPTIKELYSLILFSGVTWGPGGGARPYLDQRVFSFPASAGPGRRVMDARYMSSTPYDGRVMGNQRAFFGVNFADGRLEAYSIDGPMRRGWRLRLVRGSTTQGTNDFQNNNDGTVTDRASGLIWTRGDSGTLRARDKRGNGATDWPGALAFCETLTLAGRSDWRLPNAKELQSIVDYTRSPWSGREPALDPVFQFTSITAEDGRKDFPAYWTSTTHLAGPEGMAVILHFGRALGSGRDDLAQRGPRGADAPPPPLMDVHGAGAQRSDPKTGDPAAYPKENQGPQGDLRRVFNHARCVTEDP